MYTPALHPRSREKLSKPLEYKAIRSLAAIQSWFDLPPLRDLQVLNVLSVVWLLKARYVSPGDVWLLFNSALRKHIFSTEMAYLECFYIAVCFSSLSLYINKLFFVEFPLSSLVVVLINSRINILNFNILNQSGICWKDTYRYEVRFQQQF